MAKVIDTHSHFWPETILDGIRAGELPGMRATEGEGEWTWLVHERGLRYPLTPSFHDLEAKLAWMDETGIDISFHSIPAPFFFYELPPGETLRISRLFNDGVAEDAARSGGRIRAIATVPLNDPELAAEELRRAHGLGHVGAEVGTSLGATMLDAPQFDPLLAAAAELSMPLLLHPLTSMLGQGVPAGLDRFFLANMLGNPLETSTAAARLILGGALDRHPDLVLHLAHGGGYLPYQLARLDHGYAVQPEVAEVAERSPREYLDNFIVDTILFEPRAIEFLISIVGPERVVFGTDAPFSFADLTPLGMTAALGERTAAMMLGGNAARAYSLEERGGG